MTYHAPSSDFPAAPLSPESVLRTIIETYRQNYGDPAAFTLLMDEHVRDGLDALAFMTEMKP